MGEWFNIGDIAHMTYKVAWDRGPIPISNAKVSGHLLKARPSTLLNRIGGVMVIVLASSAVDRGLEPRSGQTRL